MSLPAVERRNPTMPPPAGRPDAVWQLVAVSPNWQPLRTERDLPAAHGRLELHPDALVYRADDVVDHATGELVVEVVPADTITDAGPMAPGTRLTGELTAGGWIAAPLRRFRCPGFVVATTAGSWIFDGPKGAKRADEIVRRYVG